MSIFGKEWDDGEKVAVFKCTTSGPEGAWEVEMRHVVSDGREYWVVHDPFSGRLMWFDHDRPGNMEARRAFKNLVELALCDADKVGWPND